jgi:aspartate aminotransferase-like enzyme
MALEPNAKAVLMAASDTSTGVAHPVAQLAETCAERGMLSVFETSASLGVSPVSLEDCGADCFTAGCEQGLSLPPGLCLTALSERAWAKARDVRPGSAVLDLAAHRKALEAEAIAAQTPPVNLLSGLAASLSLMAGHGLETIFAQRRAMAAMCRAGLTALGLAPAVVNSPASAATTFTLPDGIHGAAALQAMAENHGVLLSPAAGPGRTALAMGHLGNTDHGDVLAGLSALGQTIAAMGGASPGNDYLSQAMHGYHDSIIEGA